MGIRFLLAIAVVFSSALAAHAQDPDIELTTTVTFEVDGDRESGYEVSSRTDVSQTYRSERSLGMRSFSITEQFYDPLDDFRGDQNGDPIGSAFFSQQLAAGEDVFLSDFKVHTMSLPRPPARGETVSYSYDKSYRSPAFLPILELPNIDLISEYRIVVEHPAELGVAFDVFVPRGDLRYEVEKVSEKETHLLFTDVRESAPIAGFPFNDIRAAVMITLRDGARQVTPTGTAEFVAWYRQLVDLTPSLRAPHDTLLARTLTSLNSDRERVAAIHDYVRRTIRYIADEHAINAFVPRDPSLVLERGYGDCKDRAYLVSTIARRHGIKVDMALVNTNVSPAFAGTHVTLFNHVICAYQDGGRTLFFDPTARYCEFGNLPSGLIGAEALIIDPAAPRRVQIAQPERQPDLDVAVVASLGALDSARARVTLRSDLFHAAAEARATTTGLDFENAVSNMVTSHFQKLSFDYFEPAAQDDSSITFDCQVDLSDFVIASTAKKYIAQTPFTMSDAAILERERDTLLLEGDEREHVRLVIDLDAAGHKAESARVAIGNREPAEFGAELSMLDDGRYRFTYQLRRDGGLMRGERKASYLDFTRAFLKSKKNMFVLTKEAP